MKVAVASLKLDQASDQPLTLQLFSHWFLEDEPQSELEVPHLRLRSQAEYLPSFGRITVDAVPWLVQVHMVEYVETLRPEFKNRAFSYSEFLEQSEVALPEPRPA